MVCHPPRIIFDGTILRPLLAGTEREFVDKGHLQIMGPVEIRGVAVIAIKLIERIEGERCPVAVTGLGYRVRVGVGAL